MSLGAEKKTFKTFLFVLVTGFSFARQNFIRLFFRILGQKDFVCKTCGKKFAAKAHLAQHLLIHLNRRFLCDVCGFTTKVESHLKAHRRIHTGQCLLLRIHTKWCSQHIAHCSHCPSMFGQRGSGKAPLTTQFPLMSHGRLSGTRGDCSVAHKAALSHYLLSCRCGILTCC